MGPEPNTASSAQHFRSVEGTYAINPMEESRSSVRVVRKKGDSCKSDASILNSRRGVVSSADWYATCN